MSNNFIIDPSTVSRDNIKQDLEDWLSIQPDSAKWQDFFKSQTGQTVIELIAGLGSFLQYNAITGRRETFWKNAENRSSVIAGGESLGYSAFRGRNAILKLNVTPNSTGILNKFKPVGIVRDQDLILLEDTIVNIGVPLDIYVVIGILNDETLTIGTSNLSSFRFTKNNVSQDLRVLLNDTEVSFSERILDLINEKFVVQTNSLGSVDVMYLNSETFSTRYATGDSLKLEWVELKDLTFLSTDIKFDYGLINTITTDSVYKDPESLSSIKINSSIFNETQFVIRGRNDYKKIFKELDTLINDTNGEDISAAVVKLFYVNSDYSLYSQAQKEDFRTELKTFRPFGVQPPYIDDPTFVDLELIVNLTLKDNSGSPTTIVDDALNPYELTLGISIDFKDIESTIEENSSIKIARLSIKTTTRANSTYYLRGNHIQLSPDNGYIYESIGFVYYSGPTEPTWTGTIGEVINDLGQDSDTVSSGITWKAYPRDPLLTLTPWQANTQYNINTFPQVASGTTLGDGDLIIPSGGLFPTVMYQAYNSVNQSTSSQEVQQISFSEAPISGTVRLNYNNGTINQDTPDISVPISASSIETAIRTIPTLGDVTVQNTTPNTIYKVTYGGGSSNTSQPLLQTSGSKTNEVQCLTASLLPTAGTFSITFTYGASYTTALLPYNVDATAFQLALDMLPNIGNGIPGNVLVSGDFNTQFVIEFTGSLGNRPLPAIIVASNTLTSGTGVTISPVSITTGALPTTGINEIQRIAFSNIPDSGSFTLDFDSQYTSSLPYNASALQVQTALQALTTVNYPTGNVSVLGNMVSGFNVEFLDALGNQNLSAQLSPHTSSLIFHRSIIPSILTTQTGGYGLNETQKINFEAIPDSGSWKLSFTKGGVAEVTDITVIADSGGSLNNKYFLFDTPTTKYYVWYSVSGAGIDPSIALRTGIKVNLVTNDNQNTVSQLTMIAINSFAATTSYAVRQSAIKIRLYNIFFGAVTIATDGASPTGFSFLQVTQGVDSTFTTGVLSFNISNVDLQTALQTLPNIGSGNLIVSGDFQNGFSLDFRGTLANQDLNQVVVSNNTLIRAEPTVITGTTLTNGAVASTGIDEVQKLQFNYQPLSGVYQLKVGLETTSVLAYNASALDVQNALNALVSLSTVVVTGDNVVGFLITFQGADGKKSWPLIQVVNSTLYTSNASVTLTPCLIQQGINPGDNLTGGSGPINTLITTLVDALNPEPDWFSGAC